LAGIRIATWQHDTMMVDLEPRILRRFSDGVLVPERRIRLNRALDGTSRRHVPDAIIERSRQRPLAFELELSPKTPVRLQGILDSDAARTSLHRRELDRRHGELLHLLLDKHEPPKFVLEPVEVLLRAVFSPAIATPLKAETKAM
jgi:hypothetical protein